MGGEGEAEELFKAKVEGGETPPSSLLRLSPDRGQETPASGR